MARIIRFVLRVLRRLPDEIVGVISRKSVEALMARIIRAALRRLSDEVVDIINTESLEELDDRGLIIWEEDHPCMMN